MGPPLGTAQIDVARERAGGQVGFDRDRAHHRRRGARDGRGAADRDLRSRAGLQPARGGGVQREAFGQRHVRVADVGRIDFVRPHVLGGLHLGARAVAFVGLRGFGPHFGGWLERGSAAAFDAHRRVRLGPRDLPFPGLHFQVCGGGARARARKCQEIALARAPIEDQLGLQHRERNFRSQHFTFARDVLDLEVLVVVAAPVDVAFEVDVHAHERFDGHMDAEVRARGPGGCSRL